MYAAFFITPNYAVTLTQLHICFMSHPSPNVHEDSKNMQWAKFMPCQKKEENTALV